MTIFNGNACNPPRLHAIRQAAEAMVMDAHQVMHTRTRDVSDTPFAGRYPCSQQHDEQPRAFDAIRCAHEPPVSGDFELMNELLGVPSLPSNPSGNRLLDISDLQHAVVNKTLSGRGAWQFTGLPHVPVVRARWHGVDGVYAIRQQLYNFCRSVDHVFLPPPVVLVVLFLRFFHCTHLEVGLSFRFVGSAVGPQVPLIVRLELRRPCIANL